MRYVRQNYIKWSAYGFVLLLIFLVQSSYGLQLTLFGVHPNVIPFFLAALALYEGPACTAVIGLFAGFLCDLSITGVEGLYPLFFMVFSIVSGILAEKFLWKNIAAGILLGAVASILINVFQYVFYYAILYQTSFSLGAKLVLTELGVSVLLSPIVYVSVKLIHRHFAAYDED